MVLFPAPAGPSMATTIHFCVFSAKSQDNKRRASASGNEGSKRIRTISPRRETSTNERIDNTHAGVDEISAISRGNRQTVDERRRRDETILNWHGFPGCAQTRQQFRPFQPRVGVPGKTVENPDPGVEPTFQGGPLLPLGRMRIPNRSSPRMTGSTAISGSCARSHATTRGSGVGFVGALKTLASTKYLTAHPSTQSRWERRSPSADRRVASRRPPRSAEPRRPDEAIVPTVDTLHVELLSWFDTVHLPELRR